NPCSSSGRSPRSRSSPEGRPPRPGPAAGRRAPTRATRRTWPERSRAGATSWASGFGLHVADGSQVLVRRAGGPSLTVSVGAAGRERFGSCLRRLGEPALANGYLPMLQVAYRDAAGVRYRQESFVGRVAGGSLASFVRIVADATH